MKKKHIVFLLSGFILNTILIMYLMTNRLNFQDVIDDKKCVLIITICYFFVNVVLLYAFKLNENLKFNLKQNKKSCIFMILFTVFHFSLWMIFGKIYLPDFKKIITSTIVMTVIYGLSEIFWNDLVYEYYSSYLQKGRIRSFIIVGLYKNLQLFPLLLIPNFPVKTYSYAYFSFFLIGISAMSVFLRKYSKSHLLSILLIGIIYGYFFHQNLNQHFAMSIVGFLESFLIYFLKDLIK